MTGSPTSLEIPPEDLQLPADVAPRPTAEPPARPDVLLTGATGYLGAYLLRELQANSIGTIWCLVRAADDRAAAARLATRCGEVGINPGSAIAVAGDFTKPLFGLDAERYHELAEQIGAIHHCGASVNMNDPYQLARIPNVQGTVETLRFATSGPVKSVHHVSTMAVFISSRSCGLPRVSDESEPALEYSGTFGYAASKYVAEQLVRQASARGLPAAIYRPPFLPGDSATGRVSIGEPLSTLLKVCVQLHAAPQTLPLVPVCAVDHAARAIAALAPDAPRVGRPQAFNLHDPQPLALNEAVYALRRFGHEINPLPLAEWLSLLAENRRTQPARSLYAMFEMLPYLVQATPEHRLPDLAPARITTQLAAKGITLPPTDDAFLTRLAAQISTA